MTFSSFEFEVTFLNLNGESSSFIISSDYFWLTKLNRLNKIHNNLVLILYEGKFLH